MAVTKSHNKIERLHARICHRHKVPSKKMWKHQKNKLIHNISLPVEG